jgi:hypothetical protein
VMRYVNKLKLVFKRAHVHFWPPLSPIKDIIMSFPRIVVLDGDDNRIRASIRAVPYLHSVTENNAGDTLRQEACFKGESRNLDYRNYCTALSKSSCTPVSVPLHDNVSGIIPCI